MSFAQLSAEDSLDALNEREEMILRAIVHNYILKATPVGSRALSKYLEKECPLSPATIRNVMSDLEELGFIMHPHTSAGRMPTDRGYRYYVDSLMKRETLTPGEQLSIENNIISASQETVLRDASKLLGSISHYLGIVKMPEVSDAIVEKIDLISISSSRLLVVITLSSDIVRTITLETQYDVDVSKIDGIARHINERISGRPLSEIRENIRAVLGEVQEDDAALVRLFIDASPKLFSEQMMPGDKVHIAGAQNLFEHPEFVDTERFKSIIELIESEEIIIHLLENVKAVEGEVQVLIGAEMDSALVEDYSMLTTQYRYSNARGSIGLIGPKRMNYSKMISVLQYVATTLSLKD